MACVGHTPRKVGVALSRLRQQGSRGKIHHVVRAEPSRLQRGGWQKHSNVDNHHPARCFPRMAENKHRCWPMPLRQVSVSSPYFESRESVLNIKHSERRTLLYLSSALWLQGHAVDGQTDGPASFQPFSFTINALRHASVSCSEWTDSSKPRFCGRS